MQRAYYLWHKPRLLIQVSGQMNEETKPKETKEGLRDKSSIKIEPKPLPLADAFKQDHFRYLPEDFSEIAKWLNDGDWDKVIGFDLLTFVETTKSEEEFLDRLEEQRENREDWCTKKGMLQEKVNPAMTEAYQGIRSGRRNSLFVKRIAEKVFGDWKLTHQSDSEITRSCLGILLKFYMSDTTIPWKNPNIEQLQMDIREKILDQSSLNIGIHLSSEKREEESVSFLKDAVKRKGENAPQSVHANHWLGSTLCKLEQYAQAIPYLKTTVKLRTDPVDYRWLVQALVQVNKFYDALPYLEKIIKELGSTQASDYAYYAAILARINRLGEAINYAKKAVALEPNNQELRNFLKHLISAEALTY
jgi:tetratricopeptide (TPR) repeat protein